MRNSFIVVSLLAWLSFGCRQETSISGIVYPLRPLRVNDSTELSIMLVSPLGDELVRWRASNGKCESKDERSLSCRYLAERAGDDSVTVEVLRSGRVIAKTSVVIHVDPSASWSGASSSPSVSVGGQDSDVGDLDEATIEVAKKPPFDKGGTEIMAPISGKVLGIAKPQRFNIVIYAKSEFVWYMQPFKTAPITYIDPDGSWSTTTHLGSEYVILLVLPSYTDPPTQLDAPPHGR